MRSLQVITALQLGGAEQVAIDIALRQKQIGHHPTIVCVGISRNPGEVGAWQRRTLDEAGIPVVELGSTRMRMNMLTAPLQLARLVRELKPDLVHAHVDHADFVVSMARRLVSFKIARTIHNTILWPTHFLPGYVSEQGFRDELIITVSDDALAAYVRLREKYGLYPSRHRHVIVDGVPIPTEHVIAERRAARPKSDKRVFAFLGRYDGPKGQKGLDLLLAALAELSAQECSDVEFRIFTTGYDDPELKAAVEVLRVDCRLIPPISNARERLPQFDLVIMPSRFEGLPLLALETLANGVPLLAADAPGLRLAIPTDWPLTVPPENPAAIAAAMRKVISGNVDTARMAAIGREWVKPFSIERFFERYMAAYDSYLATSAPPLRPATASVLPL